MRHLPLCCSLALALAALPGAAQERVYQWKDANGVTHYSQNPPAGRAYQERRIDGSDPAVPAKPAAAAESADCVQARANLKLLDGNNPSLLMDSDKDGKPDKPLDEAERTRQRGLAQQWIQRQCTPTAAGS